MHIPIPGIIPHSLSLHLHCICVLAFFEVGISMRACISPTTYVATDETYPKVVSLVTYITLRSGIGLLTVATHRAAAVSPFAEAGAVEGVVAEAGQHATDGGIEALKADRASGKLNGRRWRKEKSCLVGIIQKLYIGHINYIANLGLHGSEKLAIEVSIKHISDGLFAKFDQHHIFIGRGIPQNTHMLHGVLVTAYKQAEVGTGEMARHSQHAQGLASHLHARDGCVSVQMHHSRSDFHHRVP
mmetsp:Transcript_13598/g.22425  ORF Transcript_13598/g.22425 Transcript_13598/m.22425 type:complete len:243 (+) Transcript_13598:838-1566(+)